MRKLRYSYYWEHSNIGLELYILEFMRKREEQSIFQSKDVPYDPERLRKVERMDLCVYMCPWYVG